MDKKAFVEIINHKNKVIEICTKMAEYYLDKDKQFALSIMRNGYTHDYTKLLPKEFNMVSLFLAGELDEKKRKEMIEEHWLFNDHHPEYHSKSEVSMDKLRVMEMCIDWYARSLQFGTDVFDWYEDKRVSRWKFHKTTDDLIASTLQTIVDVCEGDV